MDQSLFRVFLQDLKVEMGKVTDITEPNAPEDQIIDEKQVNRSENVPQTQSEVDPTKVIQLYRSEIQIRISDTDLYSCTDQKQNEPDKKIIDDTQVKCTENLPQAQREVHPNKSKKHQDSSIVDMGEL